MNPGNQMKHTNEHRAKAETLARKRRAKTANTKPLWTDIIREILEKELSKKTNKVG